MAFHVPQQFTGTVGQSGMLEFYVSGRSFSVLALRFNPTGSFTTAPVFPETGPPAIVPNATINISGLWGGTAGGLVVLALSQSGQGVTGTFNFQSETGSSASGSISGSVLASAFTFTTNHYFDSGGCGSQFGGTLQITGGTMQGTVTVNSDASASCGGPATSLQRQVSVKLAVEQYCGTYNNPGHDAGIFTVLVSSDGSFVGTSTVTNGYMTRMPYSAFAGQVVGNTLTQTSVDQDGSPGLIGSILNGVLSGTFGTGDPSGAVGTFSGSTTGCQ
jgi:hypothetical protein